MGSNLTCDLGPIILFGSEAEMSAPLCLCPYTTCTAVPLLHTSNLQRGDGDVASFRHAIENDAI